MSHLAKKIFEDHKSSILGDLSLSQLIRETHDLHEEDVYSHLEESGNAYYVILDPDHPSYENQLNQMETRYGGDSIIGPDTHAGFIEPEGEVSRVLVFPDEVDIGQIDEEIVKTNDPSFLKKILSDILFDFHLINETPGILNC